MTIASAVDLVASLHCRLGCIVVGLPWWLSVKNDELISTEVQMNSSCHYKHVFKFGSENGDEQEHPDTSKEIWGPRHWQKESSDECTKACWVFVLGKVADCHHYHAELTETDWQCLRKRTPACVCNMRAFTNALGLFPTVEAVIEYNFAKLRASGQPIAAIKAMHVYWSLQTPLQARQHKPLLHQGKPCHKRSLQPAHLCKQYRSWLLFKSSQFILLCPWNPTTLICTSPSLSFTSKYCTLFPFFMGLKAGSQYNVWASVCCVASRALRHCCSQSNIERP